MPEDEQERLAPHLELVDLEPKEPLHETGQRVEHVYFPLDCVVSMIATLHGDTAIEVSTIGSEGMIGLPGFLGATTSPHATFCHVPAQAARLDVAAL